MFAIAEMYCDDNGLKCYEVAQDSDGRVYHREQGTRKWNATKYTNLDAYLTQCRDQLGYSTEVL